MTEQLFFRFSLSKKFENSDIVIGEFNTNLINFLFSNIRWLTNAIFIFGNSGVGKTFVIKSFLQDKVYTELNIKKLNIESNIAELIYQFDYILLEDLKDLSSIEEELLFNIYNIAFNYNKKLIITSKKDIESLNIILPDLKSRLKYANSFEILEPSESNLKAIFFKNLSDRQLLITNNIVEYIFKRAPREAGKIKILAEKIEKFLMQRKKTLSILDAKNLLEDL